MPLENNPGLEEGLPLGLGRARAWVKRHPRLSTALSVLLFAGVALWLFLFAGLPDEEEIRSFKLESSVTGSRINWQQRFEKPVRIWAPLSQISPKLQQAVVVSEDDLFYQHHGFNLEMMKEAWRINLEKRRYVRGASTITMQLARNAFLQNREKTLRRKLRELILTRRIESALSKKQILELYLNVVEWGEGIYGAEAAARFYFDKSASHLDLGEATMLAALLPNPIYFNPFKRMKSCARMQKRVLDLMVLNRAVAAAEAADAGPSSLALRGAPPPPVVVAAPEPKSFAADSATNTAEIEDLMQEAERAQENMPDSTQTPTRIPPP